MFDFPVQVENLDDVPEVFQNLYEQGETGCTLLGDLAKKMTADTDHKIIQSLKHANEALQNEIVSKNDRVSKLNKLNDDFLMDDIASKAINAARGNTALLRPHLLNALEVAEVDGKRMVKVKEQYSVNTASGEEQPTSISDLIQNFKNDPDFAKAFDGDARTGGGMNPTGGTSGNRYVNSVDQKAINSKIEEIAAGKITVSM